MRSSSIAWVLLLAVTACDDVSLEDVDAVAADGGVDADAVAPKATTMAPMAAPTVHAVAHELQAAPSLTPITSLGGKTAMVMNLGEGSATGPIVRVSGKDSADVVLRRGHRPTEEEQALVGTTVRLHDRDGGACIGTITGFAEVASVIPAEGTRPSNRALWQLADERGGINVIAELSAPGCDDPIFADERPEQGPVAAPVQIDVAAPAGAAALARLRALPRFAAAQAAYETDAYDYDPHHPDWSETAETIMITELDLGGRHYVTAELTRDGSCGHFGATLFAIWRMDAGAYTLVLDGDRSPEGYDLAFDADADGVPELAATSELLPVEEAPWEGCGC